MYKILEKQVLNEFVVRLTVEAPLIAKKAKPGQFILLRIDESGERIPLTISDFDSEKGSVTIIVQTVGKTTKDLAKLNEGDFIRDFVGPLGRPTELIESGKAIVVGGGVGCAIAYPQAKELHKLGVHTEVIAGFKSKDFVILENEMEKVSDKFHLMTDDGSLGKKGFVTEALKEILQKDKYDLVIAIGPIPMMKAVCAVTKEFETKTIVSLNPIMIDGTGMCGGCRVSVGGEIKFACVDGPDFDGHLVDFDELARRNSFYKEEEAHACRLGGYN